MSEIIIERGVTPPERKDRANEFMFDKLEIGDAVRVPVGTHAEVQAVRQAAFLHGRSTGKRFTCRFDRSVGAIRVFRIAPAAAKENR